MKAYKVFNPDFTCRGFQYEVGKTYTNEGDISMCQEGFHACKNISDCFSFYLFDPKNKVAEVKLMGKILGKDEIKQVANKIKIVRELTWNEVLELANTGKGNSAYRNSGYSNSGYRNSGDRNSGYSNSGDRNSGDRNSGDWNSGYSNSGDRNSGDWNSGDWNSGDWNSGDWNSGYRNSGFFNSITPDEILVFNKPCKRLLWENAKKPNFIYFDLCVWVEWEEMTKEEKKDHKDAYVTQGYLKKRDYKEAWKEAYNKASKEDIELLKALPNFDSKVFEEITGIKV